MTLNINKPLPPWASALKLEERPMVLKNTYTCTGERIDKTNATIYYFGKSNKTVIVNNDCQKNKKLSNIKSFIDKIIEVKS